MEGTGLHSCFHRHPFPIHPKPLKRGLRVSRHLWILYWNPHLCKIKLLISLTRRWGMSRKCGLMVLLRHKKDFWEKTLMKVGLRTKRQNLLKIQAVWAQKSGKIKGDQCRKSDTYSKYLLCHTLPLLKSHLNQTPQMQRILRVEYRRACLRSPCRSFPKTMHSCLLLSPKPQ